MTRSEESKARAAWGRIEALGGHGVWESDMVVFSLANTGVTDDDLTLFADFPHVQILDLSGTTVGDEGLNYLTQLPALELLVVVNTRISNDALERFQGLHPNLEVTTQPPAKAKRNPFTGKPL